MTFTANALCFGRDLPATGLPCYLEVLSTELSIRLSESIVETIPLDRLAVKSGGFDRDHLVLSWTHDGEERQLYVKDRTVIDMLRTSAPHEVGHRVLHWTQRAAQARQATRTWIWLAVGSTIALCAGLWLASDLLVQVAVNRIPIEWERTLGESARRQLLMGQRVITEGAAVKALEDMSRRLTDQLPGNSYRFDITGGS